MKTDYLTVSVISEMEMASLTADERRDCIPLLTVSVEFG